MWSEILVHSAHPTGAFVKVVIAFSEYLPSENLENLLYPRGPEPRQKDSQPQAQHLEYGLGFWTLLSSTLRNIYILIGISKYIMKTIKIHERGKIDIHRRKEKFETALKRFRRNKKILAENRRLILRFIKDCELGKTIKNKAKKKIAASRLLRYLQILTRISI